MSWSRAVLEHTEQDTMEVKRLRAKGHGVTLLDEMQFWRLAQKR